MLADKPVLVVEDNVYVALDLCTEIECMNGRVIGPAGGVSEALSLLEREEVAAAALGLNPANGAITTLARALVEKGLPFVIHAEQCMPSSLSALRPNVPVLIKPIQPRDIVAILAHEIMKFELGGG